MEINKTMKKSIINLNRYIIDSHIGIKIISGLILLFTASMFHKAMVQAIDLPDFAKHSEHDIHIWTIALVVFGIIQLSNIIFVLEAHKINAIKYYRQSNTILIMSGFILLIVGCLFSLKYPPYNWQMIIFPIVGSVLSMYGRYLNKIKTLPMGIIKRGISK